MRTSRSVLILLIILTILTLTDARATSIRCGVRLITQGDFKARVLAECGEPDHVEVWEEERVYGFRNHPSYYGIYEDYEHWQPDYRYGKPYRIKKLVIIEEWTYNHGPQPVHGSPETGKRHRGWHHQRRLRILEWTRIFYHYIPRL